MYFYTSSILVCLREPGLNPRSPVLVLHTKTYVPSTHMRCLVLYFTPSVYSPLISKLLQTTPAGQMISASQISA